MAGGTWVSENKVRPGAYINVKTNMVESQISDRGTVLLPLARNWGEASFVSVSGDSDFLELLGYEADAAELLPVRECLKRARTVKVWSLNNGTRAQATVGSVTVKAVCGGSRGNDLAVQVVAETTGQDSVATEYAVSTLLDGKVMDTQRVSAAADLRKNHWVEFEIGGSLQNSVLTQLSGGTDGTVELSDYTDFLAAAEKEDFDVMAVDSDLTTVKAAVATFIKNLREEEGRCVQAVLGDYAEANHEGIISVKNGVVLADGTILDKYKAVYWVAGATAGAAVNESNTYARYEGSVDVDERYLNSEVNAALQEGSFLFTKTADGAVVEQDINTFTDFSAEKSSVIRKNRVLRVLDTLVTDIQQMFRMYFLGKVNNDVDGRNLFKAQVLAYLEELQAMSAITNLDKKQDVVIAAGKDADSVVVELAVMPVDSIEKLYMTVVIS